MERAPLAVERIWAEHAQTVFGYLVNTLRDRRRAEDVHQQVFLEVWQRMDNYDPKRASILTWVMTIARSRAIDELRRQVPEPRDPTAAWQTTVADDDPETTPDALVERWTMTHMLGRLREEESTLLRLRFYHGLSQTEIADHLGIPLGTVKTRMVAALRRMQEMMEAEQAIEEVRA